MPRDISIVQNQGRGVTSTVRDGSFCDSSNHNEQHCVHHSTILVSTFLQEIDQLGCAKPFLPAYKSSTLDHRGDWKRQAAPATGPSRIIYLRFPSYHQNSAMWKALLLWKEKGIILGAEEFMSIVGSIHALTTLEPEWPTPSSLNQVASAAEEACSTEQHL